MSYEIVLKRVQEPLDPNDGARVLVDRLWPRGRRRDAMELTDWYREASPSSLLRTQYHGDRIDLQGFAARYREELSARPDALIPLMRLARQGRLTLLSAACDLATSHLPVLRSALLEALYAEDAEDMEPASPPCWLHKIDKSR
jgi:uncharacterized protein YeaO (DUF488 family)